jgi:hypothetical protein
MMAEPPSPEKTATTIGVLRVKRRKVNLEVVRRKGSQMSEEDSLRELLTKSESFNSLRQEQEIHETFANIGWRSVHGAYYKDLQTGKTREIDVIAMQVWERRLRNSEQIIRVKVLVEAKSMKGFHLIFSDSRGIGYSGAEHCLWFGYDEILQRRLKDELLEHGLAADQVSAGVKKFSEIAFPRDTALVSRLLIEPSPATHSSSAFRETNIANAKELDNSVLWRAGQSLFSAVASLKEEVRHYHVEWIPVAIEYAREHDIHPVAEIGLGLKRHLNMVDIFHAVVVVDAQLWMQKSFGIERVPWCRFMQPDALGTPQWWFDVVDYESFSTFSRELTAYYRSTLRKMRSKLL